MPLNEIPQVSRLDLRPGGPARPLALLLCLLVIRRDLYLGQTVQVHDSAGSQVDLVHALGVSGHLAEFIQS